MSNGGSSLGQRSAVSGLRGSGPPLALVAPVPPPTGGGARPSVALYGGGNVGRRARLHQGGACRGTVPPLPPRAYRPGRWGAAVTCVVACVGAAAAAVAGSAGGSASG